MSDDPRKILSDLNNGIAAISKFDSARMGAWGGLHTAAFKGGALDEKTKELIAASIGLAVKCSYCIVFHVHCALKAGATREELMEAAFTTVGMGGGPALTYAATLYLDTVNTFAPDFGK